MTIFYKWGNHFRAEASQNWAPLSEGHTKEAAELGYTSGLHTVLPPPGGSLSGHFWTFLSVELLPPAPPSGFFQNKIHTDIQPIPMESLWLKHKKEEFKVSPWGWRDTRDPQAPRNPVCKLWVWPKYLVLLKRKLNWGWGRECNCYVVDLNSDCDLFSSTLPICLEQVRNLILTFQSISGQHCF